MPELKTTPAGLTPVECISRTTRPSRYISGMGTLTWAPKSDYPDEEGQPRRIEWLKDPKEVEYLLAAYSPPVFRIAHDLVQQAHDQAVVGYVQSAVERLLQGQQILVQDPRVDALLEQFEALLERMEALESKPRRRATRTEDES